MKKSDVCVLIPAYNETKNIRSVVEAVRARGFAVVVSDDGSKDGTPQEVEKLGVPCLVSPVNQGKGAALRRGFRWFLERPYAALILMDADGQHDPDELDLFLKTVGDSGADLVVGNRMQDPSGMSWVRRATNRLMSWMISSAAGTKIPDTQCGYRAIRREALEKLSFKTDRFEIESEMLLEAGRAGLKIESVPVRSVYRDEQSRIRPLQDTARFIRFFAGYLFSRRSGG